MISKEDAAVMAGSVYVSTRTVDNQIGLPEGWFEYKDFHRDDKESGFEANAYEKGSEIVVSFAGTYMPDSTSGKPAAWSDEEAAAMSRLDWANNIGLGFGAVSEQLRQAALFYERVKQSAPAGSHITITGHSLGGGLAAVIGVLFDVDTFAFDEAFFRAAADQSNVAELRRVLANAGLEDPSLDSYMTSGYYGVDPNAPALGGAFVGLANVLAMGQITVPTTIPRESRVRSIYTDGEVLQLPREYLGLGIGASTPVNHGWTALTMGQLHSMTLLTAFEIHDPFRLLSLSLPSAGTLIFNQKLYAARTDGNSADFLSHVVREQVGTDGSNPDGMLAQLTTDLGRLSPGVGQARQAAIDALTVATIEYYSFQPHSYAGALLFQAPATGLLRFDDPTSTARSVGELTKVPAYLSAWLSPLIGPNSGDLSFEQWSVAIVNANATFIALDADKSQVMLGLGGADSFVGGSKADLLFGDDGADTLDGGADSDSLFGGIGNDVLYGGAGGDLLDGGYGSDLYMLVAGELSDVIEDADGNGSINIGGNDSWNAKAVAANTWITDDRNWTFAIVGTSLVMSSSSAIDDTIVVRNWTTMPGAHLGISLSSAQAAAAIPTTTYIGDFSKRTTTPGGDSYDRGPGNNYVSDGAEANAQDMITGTADADSISGLGGNDALSGFDGDDILEGGSGDDVLMGGAGRDSLYGGSGNDYIFGSGNGSQVRPNVKDLSPPTANGPESTRGFYWVAYQSGIDGNGRPKTVFVNVGIDTASGDAANVVDGGAGNDSLYAGSGNDVAFGGDDDDMIFGLGGADVLFGDAGDDLLLGDGISTPGDAISVAPSAVGSDVLDGGIGDDTLIGQGGNDTLEGGADDDRLFGDQNPEGGPDDTPLAFHGKDYLDGGDGNDYLEGGGNDDRLYGGSGNDNLWGDGDPSVVTPTYHGRDYLDGEDGNDALNGGGGDDVLFGGAGDDSLWGDGSGLSLDGAGHGADYLDGEDGNDFLEGGGRDDTLFGGIGADTLVGDSQSATFASSLYGRDDLSGEEGDDVLIGGGGADRLDGGEGADHLYGDDNVAIVAETDHGADVLDGGNGDDLLVGGGRDDTLSGGDGNDFLYGDALGTTGATQGQDFLDGGSGADVLVGGGNADVLDGGDGNDQLHGDDNVAAIAGVYHGADTLVGGLGDDTLWGDGGDDVLEGGAGNDYLAGEDEIDYGTVSALTGNDRLDGGEGDDSLVGGNGNDTLLGGNGRDALFGGAGDDVLEGGWGADYLDGGAGDDVYRISLDETRSDGGLRDAIVDLSGNNRIEFTGGVSVADVSLVDAGGTNIILSYGGSQVQVSDAMRGTARSITFADGTSLSLVSMIEHEIRRAVYAAASSQGTLIGGAAGDGLAVYSDSTGVQVWGGLGDDNISIGANATDVQFNLDVGDGNDRVSSGGGGSGNRVVFGDGVASANLSAWLASSGAIGLRYSDSDSLQFGSGAPSTVLATFASYVANDATLTAAQLVARGIHVDLANTYATVAGTADNDIVDGIGVAHTYLTGAGNDTITFGADVETAVGGSGNDVYHYGVGAGRDVVDNRSAAVGEIDEIHIGSELTPANVQFFHVDDDLYVKAAGTADRLQVLGFFTNVGSERIVFSDGTTYTRADIPLSTTGGSSSGNDDLLLSNADDVVDALDGDDIVLAGGGDDSISGGNGNDTLFGGSGADTLRGGADMDSLDGGDGADVIDGGDFDDILRGGSGDDLLLGAQGNDTLYGDQGNDTLDAAAGAAMLDGGLGDDLYRIARGSSTNIRYSTATGDSDVIEFGPGILPSDIVVQHERQSIFHPDQLDNLVMFIRDGAAMTPLQAATVAGFFSGTGYAGIARVTFSSQPDTVWTPASIRAMVLAGTSGDDTITGFATADVLTGGTGRDSLIGLAGDDTLDGGTGSDSLAGGEGNDTYLFNRGTGRDEVGEEPNYVTSTTDTVRLGEAIAPTDITLARSGNDLLISIDGTPDLLRIRSHFGDNYRGIEHIVFGGSDTAWDLPTILSKTAGNGTPINTIGTVGDDTFTIVNAGDTVIEGLDQGTDLIQSPFDYVLPGNVENLTLTGTLGINGTGNTLSNVIVGNAGDNQLSGGNGGTERDTLVGGAGNDTYVIEYLYGLDRTPSIDEEVVENANAGIDRVQIDWYSPSGYSLPDNVEELYFTNRDGGTTDAYGNQFPRYFSGNDLDNVIDYSGLTWAAVLNGGLGADTMLGGAEDTRYIVDDVGDVVFERSTASTGDEIVASVSYALAPNIERLVLQGNAETSGTGNDADNILDGSVNPAANALAGGLGDDVYRIGANDTVVETAGQGNDAIEFAWRPADSILHRDGYATTASIERYGVAASLGAGLTLVGSAGADDLYLTKAGTLLGGAGNDTLTTAPGSTGTLNGGDDDDLLIGLARVASSFYGDAGNDTIRAIGGADTLDGGTGDDLLDGGDDADVFYFGPGGGHDTIAETWTYSNVPGVLNFREGIDPAQVTVSRSGADVVFDIGTSDRVTIRDFLALNAYGQVASPVDRVVFHDNTTWSRTTIRTMADPINHAPAIAAALPDRAVAQGETFYYQIPNESFVDSDTGDRLGYSATMADGDALPDWIMVYPFELPMLYGAAPAPGNYSFRVTATDELGLQASDVFALTVSDSPLQLEGGPEDDLLQGGSGNDSLYGGEGNDTLDGSAGHDQMVGGMGDDVFIVDNIADTTYESPGEGTDVVRASVSHALADNIENLALTGSEAINATGNGLRNRLTGNAGANVLNGGAGIDTMIGGIGNDTYLVETAGDIVVESAGDGDDTVRSSISYALGPDVEQLVLTGTTDINGTGNDLANVVFGNAAANVLSGGAGPDTLNGGSGNDTYVLVRGGGSDVVVDMDSTAGNSDVARFGSDVSADQLWFRQRENDLEISIIGGGDQLRVAGWYLGADHHIEQFRSGSDLLLLDSQVQILVQAMASFSPPPAGQTTLPPDYASSLNPVIAANWH